VRNARRLADPKSEIRNSKFETNPKFKMEMIQTRHGFRERERMSVPGFEHLSLRILNLFRISDFEFRVSNPCVSEKGTTPWHY